ncbi:hypothetical protein Dxin01_04205 [Deinococcus xinjiangensis]|uniref:Uncharacterized protein n=2 Tax=Deinococcus xinjiangensis TaxID=457454 RepID=A0ABP9VGU1_9DEIO
MRAMEPSPEATLKALELLQGIINRLSGNSFLLKGWTVTLVIGLLTYTGSTGRKRLALMAAIPVLMFWFLDGFFLARERDYRDRFEKLRLGQVQPFDFRLSPLNFGPWIQSAFSSTLAVFYGFLLVFTIIIAVGVL